MHLADIQVNESPSLLDFPCNIMSKLVAMNLISCYPEGSAFFVGIFGMNFRRIPPPFELSPGPRVARLPMTRGTGFGAEPASAETFSEALVDFEVLALSADIRGRDQKT
jgi:hypothetical protein